MKRSRFKVRRLYVFGAGASFDASRARAEARQAPLDMHFCSRIETLNVQRPKWVEAARAYVLNEWKDHTPFSASGLEQAIIRQVAHLEFIDAIHPRRRSNAVSEFSYLNNLSHLICLVLRKAREAKNGPYERFHSLAFPPGMQYDELRDRIITFNYDELLDAHLLERFSAQQLYFDKLKDKQSDRRRRAARIEDPLLVKLHGSVNWRCATEEFEKIVNGAATGKRAGYYIKQVWLAETGTPSPEDATSPLIIPPLPVKPITNISLFCFLWTKAYEYLHEAEELVICGYSLPDADRLAQSLFANFTNRKLRKVTVVDPNPGIMSKWRGLFRRSNVNQHADWMYYETFTEYVDALEEAGA